MSNDYLNTRHRYNRYLNSTEELIMSKIRNGEYCADYIDYRELLKARLKDNEQNRN